MNTGNEPLCRDIRVLEVANFFAGPHCAMLLADLGADVIKIERPGTGDPTRNREDDSGYAASFAAKNRSKRSMELDLSARESREILHRLVARSDVFITNLRPMAREALGIEWDAMREVNNRIIYCSITGDGETGIARNRPAFDTTAQARSGLLRLVTDQFDSPMTVKALLADLLAGYYACYGVMGALIRRARTGRGSLVTTSLLQAAIALGDSAFFHAFESLRTGSARERLTMRTAGFLLTSSDGKPFAVHMPPSPVRFWEGVVQAFERTDLTEDPRFSTKEGRERNYAALHAELNSAAKNRTRQDWCDVLESFDIPVAPINELNDVFEDRLVEELGMLFEVVAPAGYKMKYVGSGINVSDGGIVTPTRAPLLGEHTTEILQELGYTSHDRRPEEPGGTG